MKKRICAAAVSLSLCASMAFGAGALDVEKARELLDEYYIAPLPAAAQQAQSVEELLAGLNDPYTIYYSSDAYTDFLAQVNGEELTGVGVSVSAAFEDGFHIMSVFPDSPAQEAGLKAGDVFIAVNGVPLTPQDSIPALLTGEAGTSVTVTVRRADGSHADFTMERRLVRIPIITFDDQGNIGWFDCSSFGSSTPDGISAPLLAHEKDVALWVMDLRDNPGGLTDYAVITAACFAGWGDMVYFRDGQEVLYTTRPYSYVPDLTNKPLIVLTSPSTASASEVFLGAIRDYGAGITIGQRTYGKGIAQVMLDESSMPDVFQGDSLKITAYQFFSPAGLTSHLTGILPTLLVGDEHLSAVTRLLSSPAPTWAQDWLKLELAGHTFYLSPIDCREDPDTLRLLLEALPVSARLYLGYGEHYWNAVTPAEAAARKKIDYQPATFSDVSESPYRTAIETLARYGLVSGDGTGNFLPENTMTRGELCAMLASVFHLPAGDSIPFSDVNSDAWYADGVSALAALGFVTGTGDGTFRPDAPVTNQEVCTVLSAIAAWAHLDAAELAKKDVSAYQWLDVYYYPEWAQGPARNLDKLGVTLELENPDTPTSLVTRGACAGMVYELMEALGMFWY